MATTNQRKKPTRAKKANLGAVSYYTSPNSPFGDGYDLDRNRQDLADVIHAAESGEEIAFDHPKHDAYMLFLERQKRLQEMSKGRSDLADRESRMTRQEARQYKQLGALGSDEDDELVLHTKEAFQLFTGRATDPDNPKAPAIISFKKVGAAYRQLWNLSSNNNPYADWALITLSASRDEMHGHLTQSTQDLEASLARMAQTRGLKISVSKSANPQSVPIRFKSPYAYQLIESLAEFDYVIRVIRTMVFKGRLTTKASDQLIRLHMRQIRGHFNNVRKMERYLTDPELMLLTRHDFLPIADDVSRARVARCVELFGQVPRSIFEMQDVPQFKSHRSDVSEKELALLRQVTAGVADDDFDADAAESSEGLL